jgi:hypothetical protein
MADAALDFESQRKTDVSLDRELESRTYQSNSEFVDERRTLDQSYPVRSSSLIGHKQFSSGGFPLTLEESTVYHLHSRTFQERKEPERVSTMPDDDDEDILAYLNFTHDRNQSAEINGHDMFEQFTKNDSYSPLIREESSESIPERLSAEQKELRQVSRVRVKCS